MHFCGGVLITPIAVLTAAHCTFGQTRESMKITIGEHIRSQPSDNKKDTVLSHIFNHPSYGSALLANDISLLILSEALEWSEWWRPACAPSQPASHYADHVTTVSGWGSERSGGLHTEDLRYTNVPLMSRADCERCMNGVIDGMKCAGACGANQRDSCQGDSGGPLVYKNKQGLFEIVGIVSWGFGCASATPGVYTDVYYYLDWIDANLSKPPQF